MKNWRRYVSVAAEHVSLRTAINNAVLGECTLQLYLMDLESGAEQMAELLKVPVIGKFGPTTMAMAQLHDLHCHSTAGMDPDVRWTITAMTMLHPGRRDGVRAHIVEVNMVMGELAFSWGELDALEPDVVHNEGGVTHVGIELAVVPAWARRTYGWLQAMVWSLESERLLHQAQEEKERGQDR